MKINIPSLKKIHSGKVRDSFKLDDDRRLIVVSDRISAFDHILNAKIPIKGSILNSLSNFWFKKTSHIINNHLIEQIAGNASIVQEAKPIKLEIILRKYITGSLWRNYLKGARKFSTYTLSNNLKENSAFNEVIITPTTKDISDQEISYHQIIENKILLKEQLDYIYDVSLSLFNFASSYLEKRGLILVDTKFEFAFLQDKIILIDEIFTPDSSRFWYKSQYDNNPLTIESPDKEFVRKYLLNEMNSSENKNIPMHTPRPMPLVLPENIISDTSKRYLDLYKNITENNLQLSSPSNPLSMTFSVSLSQALVEKNIIKDGLIVIVMGSKNDLSHALKIKEICKMYAVDVILRVISAHKNGEEIINLANEINNSITPVVVVAIAGRSNGLGGALAYNLSVPVINIPPFKDNLDMFLNINSSLIMPQNATVATTIDIEGGTRLALKSLQIERLRNLFNDEILKLKEKMNDDDQAVQLL
ncbi:MAG: AIR carboxylase family protein [Oligoflexia bacterium]|nr:AIR carboxylase family protein [Oligoflexia bacterium]